MIEKLQEKFKKQISPFTILFLYYHVKLLPFAICEDTLNFFKFNPICKKREDKNCDWIKKSEDKNCDWINTDEDNNCGWAKK